MTLPQLGRRSHHEAMTIRGPLINTPMLPQPSAEYVEAKEPRLSRCFTHASVAAASNMSTRTA